MIDIPGPDPEGEVMSARSLTHSHRVDGNGPTHL